MRDRAFDFGASDRAREPARQGLCAERGRSQPLASVEPARRVTGHPGQTSRPLRSSLVPKPPGQPVFQLRITLQNIHPPIWRRLLVPGSVRLDRLHRMIQAAFGWEDYHLHAFRIGAASFGMQLDDYPEEELDETTVTVAAALEGVGRFDYEYDFGDSWEHEVVVEDFWRAPLGLKFGVCIDGQKACPPEDVGGYPGYEEFLEAVTDPDHEDHERLLTWAGGSFDPAAFDLALANARLQKAR